MSLRLTLTLPFGVRVELLTWTEQPEPETSPEAPATETTAVRDLGPQDVDPGPQPPRDDEPPKPPKHVPNPIEGGLQLDSERAAGFGFERVRWSPLEGDQPDP